MHPIHPDATPPASAEREEAPLSPQREGLRERVAEWRFRAENYFPRVHIHRLDGRNDQFLRREARLRRGDFRFRARRSIWICGDLPSQFVAADEVIAGLKQAAPECCFALLSEAPHTYAWLKRRYPNDHAFPAPGPGTEEIARFFEQLQPALLVVLQSARGVNPLLLRLATERRLPVVLIDGRPQPRETTGSWARALRHPALDHYAVQSPKLARALLDHDVPEEKISVAGALGFEKVLLTPKSNAEYLKRELCLPADARLVMADHLHQSEERPLLSLFARLRATHPTARLLWKTVAERQLVRAEALADKLGLPSRRWDAPPSETAPALLFLDPTLSAEPFHPACAAVLAGGTFTPLPALLPYAEPLTLHAPVIYGPFLPYNAVAARAAIAYGAAFQSFPTRLDSLLATFLRQDPDELAANTAERATPFFSASRGAAQRTLEAILPHYPAPPADAAPSDWRPPPSATAPSAAIPKIKIPDWPAFRERLSPYRSILCLGNGPTSELPEIPHLPHDTLFRTNHRWIDRGILTEPKVVFAGSRETLRTLKGPIFVLSEVMGRIQTLEDNQLEDREPFEVFIPTTRNCDWLDRDQGVHTRASNGALMIATAAALQPEAITIAGIDLFSHPDGRYPGEFQAVNAYSQYHKRNHELDIIEQALRSFRGRITILSPILKEALLQRQFPAERLES